MKTRTRQTLLITTTLLAAGIALSGCTASSRSDYAQTELLRQNLTPNLDTLHQRPDDIANAMSLMADENGRMFWEDMGRAFYTDRPSRLTREPVPW